MDVDVNFLFELGQLKRVKRSGWWTIGIENPESVAEHSFRAAALGYILAKMENVNTEKTVLMCLFNDLHETRINDLHKVGHRYIDFKSAETKVFKEQMKLLPKEMSDELTKNHMEFQNQTTKEGIVARDADLLECAIQAREYICKGNKNAKNWIDNIKKLLETESAKKIIEEIEKKDAYKFWEELKKIKR